MCGAPALLETLTRLQPAKSVETTQIEDMVIKRHRFFLTTILNIHHFACDYSASERATGMGGCQSKTSGGTVHMPRPPPVRERPRPHAATLSPSRHPYRQKCAKPTDWLPSPELGECRLTMPSNY